VVSTELSPGEWILDTIASSIGFQAKAAFGMKVNGRFDRYESAITVGYARFNDKTVEGFISGPLTENLTARLAFSGEYSDPWQISETTGQQLGRENRVDGRILVDWNPIDRLKLAFNVTGTQDKSDPQALQFAV